MKRRRTVPVEGENVEEDVPVTVADEERTQGREMRHGMPRAQDEALHDFMEDQEEHMRLRDILEEEEEERKRGRKK